MVMSGCKGCIIKVYGGRYRISMTCAGFTALKFEKQYS